MANRSCSAIRADGGRCRAIAITGSDYCHAHHPDRGAQRSQAARKGGRRGGRGRPNVLIAQLREDLLEIVEQVRDDSVAVEKAAVMGRLLRYAIQSVGDEIAAREHVELTQRVEELEQLLARKERSYA